MAILTGPEILKRMEKGEIVISPFNSKHVNPNSVDLTLASTLKVYEEGYASHKLKETRTTSSIPVYTLSGCPLDMRENNPTVDLTIPEEGLILYPGVLYLGSTIEWTATYGLVPYLDGRSSIGRLGISIHETAGRGDNGFCGHWTCELSVLHPVKIYSGVRICQITYHEVVGEQVSYRGKYQNAPGPQASRLYHDFQ